MHRFEKNVGANDQECHFCGSESAEPLGVLGQGREAVDLVEEHFGTSIKPFAVLEKVDKFGRTRFYPIHDDGFDRMGDGRLSRPLHMQKVGRKF